MPTGVFLSDPSLETMLVVRRAQASVRSLVRGGHAHPGLSLHFHAIVASSGAETDELHERFCSAHITHKCTHVSWLAYYLE